MEHPKHRFTLVWYTTRLTLSGVSASPPLQKIGAITSTLSKASVRPPLGCVTTYTLETRVVGMYMYLLVPSTLLLAEPKTKKSDVLV